MTQFKPNSVNAMTIISKRIAGVKIAQITQILLNWDCKIRILGKIIAMIMNLNKNQSVNLKTKMKTKNLRVKTNSLI